MTPPIRTVVADDHALFLEGLVAILRGTDGIEVVATATTGEQAVAAVAAHRPDVVLMDLKMPGLDGVAATARCARVSPDTSVIMVTMIEDDEALFSAMCAGARGYLVKGSDTRTLLRAVRSAAANEVLFSSGVADRVLALFDPAEETMQRRLRPFPELTGREYEILQLVALGLSNAEIGVRLSLSSKTIANNLSNVYAKLRVTDRAQAIVKANRAGLGH